MSSIIHSSVCEQELKTDGKLYLTCTGNTTCQCAIQESFSLYRITELFHFPVYVSQGKDPATCDLPGWYSEYSTNRRNCEPVLNYNESNCYTSDCMCNFGRSPPFLCGILSTSTEGLRNGSKRLSYWIPQTREIAIFTSHMENWS